MKATELRIGNWIRLKRLFIEPNVIDYQIKEGHDIHRVQCGEYFASGIPLTEEWLLKFGFKAHSHNERVFMKSKFVLEQGANNMVVGRDKRYYFTNHVMKSMLIAYVHQLQNLYFALTETELTVTE